jgi:hypothetical protein
MADTQVWILRLGDLIKLAAMRSRSAAADAALIALRRWGEHGERQFQCCAERVGPRAEAYVLTFGEDRLRPESVGESVSSASTNAKTMQSCAPSSMRRSGATSAGRPPDDHVFCPRTERSLAEWKPIPALGPNLAAAKLASGGVRPGRCGTTTQSWHHEAVKM